MHSFQIYIPGARLFIREKAAAISSACKSSRPILIEGELREEIEAWDLVFAEKVHWLPWRKERHVSITLASDASKFAWGGVIGEVKIADLWDENDTRPIHLKEAEALYNTLRSVSDQIKNKRVDAYVDNMAVLKAWEHGGAKDVNLNRILKIVILNSSTFHLGQKSGRHPVTQTL
jgi:hypothetical protein